MTFDIHDVNTQTGEVDDTGFPDEYPLDDTVVSLGDHVRPKVSQFEWFVPCSSYLPLDGFRCTKKLGCK